MSIRWVPLILVMLSLAGCYRSASENEALQDFDNPTVVEASATPLPQQEATTTNTPPPVTRIQPTATVEEATVQPQQVEATATATRPQPTAAQATSAPPTATPQFITPAGPSGPAQIDTPPPTLGGTPSTATPSGLITPTDLFTSGDGTDECTYTVQNGDNLFRIALDHGITEDELRTANPQLSGNIIHPGDILTIPDCGQEETETVEATATPATGSESAGGIIHVVQPGETLSAIARRYGVSVEAILDANGLSNPDRLDVDQELIIP